MSLPASGDLPNYPSFANARLYDAEFDRMVAQCMAYGEGIAPFDQSCDCTITGMGANKATDLEVTTNSSGLQLSVALGNAWVQGDSRTTQGLYFCHVPTATTVTTTAANATHPRIDAIVLQVNDADADGGGATSWEIVCEAGTATSGATLSNLTGAPTIPDSALLLAYVLVPATFAGPFVNATHILDRRMFAYRPGRRLGIVGTDSDLTATLNNTTLSSALLSVTFGSVSGRRVAIHAVNRGLFTPTATGNAQLVLQLGGTTVSAQTRRMAGSSYVQDGNTSILSAAPASGLNTATFNLYNESCGASADIRIGASATSNAQLEVCYV